MVIEKAQEALKKYFGYDEFRPMQADIIQAVYEKKDALVLMPTGGGKSICFQIPAITMEGLCIVVSPLISLMKDQVESLKANGIAASFLNSSQTSEEQRFVEDELYHGRVKLLYVSPEKMVSQGFLPLLKNCQVNLFAIDEAHCVSSWGHDFRPEYVQMQFLKRQFPDVPMIALTATADKITRRDIVEQLKLDSPEIFIASFDRPNISLEVRPGQKRIEQIVEFIKERPNTSGIIYCLSRKNTEDIAKKLTAKGIAADYYHAGMSDVQRSKVQEEFINDNLPIVCATIAFGMGIDKSNVRWVIHYNLPKNMEGYYQEIGRSGRDGAKAETLLFYSFRDVIVMREILTQNKSENEAVQLAKLDRIQQYADSLICRRKILLNYFNEHLEEDCGNCDVCKNPPQYFVGTVITQKALSAIYRLKEKVAMGLLIDILRGSRRKEIISRGYDRVKTYGAGADISQYDWQLLIQQMINLGLIEMAYDQYNILKLTPESKEVLFEGRKVQLVKMKAIKERKEKKAKVEKTQTKRQRVRDELFEQLRLLRKQLAQKKGVPPYIIFSDATLEEMAAVRPTNDIDMRNISGVGEQKMQLYAKFFMKEIINFIGEKSKEGLTIKGSTQLQTLQFYNRGLPIAEIARHRDMAEQTILSHLVQLYKDGHEVDVKRFVKTAEIEKIYHALGVLPEPFKLKDIYGKFDGKVSYTKIHFAMAYLEKHGKV